MFWPRVAVTPGAGERRRGKERAGPAEEREKGAGHGKRESGAGHRGDRGGLGLRAKKERGSGFYFSFFFKTTLKHLNSILNFWSKPLTSIN